MSADRFERHRQPWTQDEVQKLHLLAKKGMALKAIVHFGVDFLNAYWDSVFMTMGDGDKVLFLTFVLLNVIVQRPAGDYQRGQFG